MVNTFCAAQDVNSQNNALSNINYPLRSHMFYHYSRDALEATLGQAAFLLWAKWSRDGNRSWPRVYDGLAAD